MLFDSVIAEVRQAREELAKRSNYDLGAMIHDARERQAASGRRVVTAEPRPAREAKAVRPFGENEKDGTGAGR